MVPFSTVTEDKWDPCQDTCGLVVGSHVMLDRVLEVLVTVFMELTPFILFFPP